MSLDGYKKIYDGDPEKFGVVAVLYGGTSSERSVSLDSGKSIIAALEKSDVAVLPIDIKENVCVQIINAQFDRAFIALHLSLIHI